MMRGFEKFKAEVEITEFENAVRVTTNSSTVLPTKNGVLLDERELEVSKSLHMVESVSELENMVNTRMEFPREKESKFLLETDIVIMTFENFKKLTE